MRQDHDFPTDILDEADHGASAVRWASGVVALAALALALANADALAGWSEDLTPSPLSSRVVGAAEEWKQATERLRLDRPHSGFHRAWERAETIGWPGGRLRARPKPADDDPAPSKPA